MQVVRVVRVVRTLEEMRKGYDAPPPVRQCVCPFGTTNWSGAHPARLLGGASHWRTVRGLSGRSDVM